MINKAVCRTASATPGLLTLLDHLKNKTKAVHVIFKVNKKKSANHEHNFQILLREVVTKHAALNCVTSIRKVGGRGVSKQSKRPGGTFCAPKILDFLLEKWGSSPNLKVLGHFFPNIW